MLLPDEACAFFAYARELFPQSHLRMYTAGDLLDRMWLERLGEAGLDEIRFSIKQDDPPHLQELVLENMTLALDAIPAVMVEMPPIPGTESQMKDLLRRFNEVGIHGINLLEFTYPFWNWTVFDSLGLTLKNPPYRVFFDYAYAGALAVQGSEELCLRLMLWAHEQGYNLGMHYCSLENKHRAQIRPINEPHALFDKRYAFDYGDFFMKTAIVFGSDRDPVRKALVKQGCKDFLEDEGNNSTSFHPRWMQAASRICAEDGTLVQPCISSNVVVERDGGFALRELKLELASDAAPVQTEDLTEHGEGAFEDEQPSQK